MPKVWIVADDVLLDI